MLYQGLVRIPLLIFEPGRTSRLDVHSPTSAIDVLPTLLQLGGESPAPWAEGTVLPPYATNPPDPNRPVYCLNVKSKNPRAPLTVATAMQVTGNYKLLDFFGYEELGPGSERIELYDLAADPEELTNLYPTRPDIGAGMLKELKAKLAQVNQPYL